MTSETVNLELQIVRDENKTERQQMTEGMLSPAVSNAENCVRYGVSSGWREIGLTEAMQVLSDRCHAVNSGDLSAMESTLVAQSAALNSVFIELTRRAHLNMGSHMDAMERYLRLALKAQTQCRATIETLAVIKNPPVYAKQANINNGGQQQVNNGVPAPQKRQETDEAVPRAGGKKNRTRQPKLLEASHGERLDTRTKSKARRSDQALEAVGEIHRAED